MWLNFKPRFFDRIFIKTWFRIKICCKFSLRITHVLREFQYNRIRRISSIVENNCRAANDMNEGVFFILSSLGTARRVFGGTRIGFFRTTPLWTSLKTWSCLSLKLGWRVILCSYGVVPAVMLQNADLSPIKPFHHTLFFFSPSSFFVSPRVVRETRTHASIDCIAFDSWWNLEGGWTSCHFNIREMSCDMHIHIILESIFLRSCNFLFSSFVESILDIEKYFIINSPFFYISLKSKV